jgi:hypothetical protein
VFTVDPDVVPDMDLVQFNGDLWLCAVNALGFNHPSCTLEVSECLTGKGCSRTVTSVVRVCHQVAYSPREQQVLRHAHRAECPGRKAACP